MTEHVPTVAELASMRPPLAYQVAGAKGGTYWRVTDEGHALLGWIMRENGKENRR